MARLNSRKIKKALRSFSVNFLFLKREFKFCLQEFFSLLTLEQLHRFVSTVQKEISVIKTEATRDIKDLRRLFTRKNFHIALSFAVFALLVFQVFIPNIKYAYGATYTFVQTSWAGGVSGNAASHPGNQTGWNNYSAASSTITFASPTAPTLTTSSYAYTDDATTSTTSVLPVAGGGFANGTNNNTQYVAGANPTANISLASTVINLNRFDTQIQQINTTGTAGITSYAHIAVTGTKSYVLQGNNTNAVLVYDSAADSWDNFKILPSNAGTADGIAVDGSYLYVVAGGNTTGVYRHTLANTSSAWDTYGTASLGSIGNVAEMGNNLALDLVNGYLYVGAFYASSTVFRHALADTTSAWDILAAAPGNLGSNGSNSGGALVVDTVNNYLYALQGGNQNGFYRHSLANTSSAWDSFTALPSPSQGTRIAIDPINNMVYASYSTGYVAVHTLSTTTGAWDSLQTVGLGTCYSGLSYENLMVDSNYVYALCGNGSNLFLRHVLANGSNNTSTAWQTFTNIPGPGVGRGGGFGIGSDNYIYLTTGNGTPFFHKHTLANTSSAWISTNYSNYPNLPGNVAVGGGIAKDSNYIYVLAGGSTSNVYRHTLVDTASAWDSFSTTGLGAVGTYDGKHLAADANYIYVMQGSGNYSYRHTTADTSSAWQQIWNTDNIPFGVGAGLVLDASYIYATQGASTGNFYRHTMANTSTHWDNYPQLPSLAVVSQNTGPAIDNNYVYVAQGLAGSNFYRHTLSDTSSPWDLFNTSGFGTQSNGSSIQVFNNNIYVVRGGATTNINRHTTADTSSVWTVFGTTGLGALNSGAALAFDSSYLYALQGNAGYGLYRHTLADTSSAWTPFVGPGQVNNGGGMVGDGANNLYIVQGNTTPNVYRFIINQTTYAASGDYTSAAIALNGQRLNSLSWNASSPSYCGANTVRFQIATSSDNVSWSSFVGSDGTSGTYFSSSPATFASALTNRAVYFKYKVYLQTANTAFTPSVNDVTINYDQYNPSGAIVSSKYDSTDPTNVFSGLAWGASVPSGSSIQFQVATSSDGNTWAPWVGPDGQTNSYFTSSGQNVTGSIIGRYFQTKAFFSSTGAVAPALTSVTSTYVINAAPTVRVTTQATQQTNGTVSFSYEVRDIDTDTDTNSINSITPSFQYCVGGGSTCYTLTKLSAGATSTQNVPTGSSSTPYSVTWTPSQESFANGVYDTGAVIRVTADDLQGANRYGYASSSVFTLDTMAPPSTSIHVDASSTQALVTLLAVDTSTPIMMRLATSLGALSSAAYEAYSTSKSMTLSDPSTVYVQFKDNYSNETTPISVTTPGTPTSVIVQDTTNMLNTPPDYREFIAWKVVSLPSLGFGAYKVYRSLDASEPRNWTLVSSVTDRSINYYTDSSVPSLTVVYYKVITTDAQGNVSFSSSVVQARADGAQNYGEGGGGGGVGPIITNIATSTVAASSIHVTWDTDKLSNSTVGYSTTPGIFGNAVTVASMVNSSTSAGQHQVILANLVPNTTYYFQVRSQDINGNYTVDNNSSTGYVFKTTDGPTITSGPTASSVFNTSAVITWQTNLPSNSTIFYSTSSDFATSASVSDLSTYNSTHSLTVSSLTPSTQYFYYVRSIDGSGNIAYDQNVVNGVAQYYTFYTTNDTAAPVFTNLVAAVNTTTAVISWHTDKPTDSRLNYGLTGTYGSSTYDSFLSAGHSITLNNLIPNTTYHYQLVGADANGNSGQTGDQTFLTGTPVDTTPPVISNVATTSVAIDRATVTWTTSKNTNATVDVGTTLSYGSLFGSLYDFTTSSHSVDLTGLLGNTLYYFRVNSADVIGNSASSTGSFITIPDVTPPQIISTSTLVNDTAAFVNWITDERSLGFVNYGTDPNVLSNQVAVTSTYYISHSLPITGLITQTQYYYQIITSDPSANTTTLPVESFTTLAAGQQTVTVTKVVDNTKYTDTSLPSISNLSVTNITPFGATVGWSTDKDSSSLVKYGRTTSYGFLAGDEITQAQSHSVPIVNLSPATTYHFKAESFDKYGNLGESSDQTFTTLNVDGTEAKPSSQPQSSEEEKQAALDNLVLDRLKQAPTKLIASVLDVLSNNPFLKELNDTDAVKAFSEVASQIGNAPIIVGLRPTVEVHGNSATVRWSTDKNTTGLVAFAKESEYAAGTDKPYTTSIVDAGGLSNTHVVELPSLEASTRYHFQVASKGEIGPEGRSKDYTFETEAVLPEITDAKVTDVKATEAIVSWKTNVPTASDLEFTNLSSSTSKALTSGDQALLITHTFTLRNLDPGSKYSLTIKAKNESGQEASSTPLTFETIIDKEAPVISNVAANSTIYPGSASKVQTIISWETNELAESQLFYQEGVGDTDNIKSMPLETSFTNKHFIVLTGFKSGAVYKYWIESTDQSGNKGTSEKFTTLTPTEKQTIIDIITNNFQSVFGWTKNVGL